MIVDQSRICQQRNVPSVDLARIGHHSRSCGALGRFFDVDPIRIRWIRAVRLHCGKICKTAAQLRISYVVPPAIKWVALAEVRNELPAFPSRFATLGWRVLPLLEVLLRGVGRWSNFVRTFIERLRQTGNRNFEILIVEVDPYPFDLCARKQILRVTPSEVVPAGEVRSVVVSARRRPLRLTFNIIACEFLHGNMCIIPGFTGVAQDVHFVAGLSCMQRQRPCKSSKANPKGLHVG